MSADAADKGKKKAEKAHPTGYADTPMLPGGKWRVHDDTRPRPKVVTAGKKVGEAPSDAIVLFDGTKRLSKIGSRGMAVRPSGN